MATFETLKDNTQRDRARALRATTPTPRRGCGMRCAPPARRLALAAPGPEGPFILDFLCVEASLVVELDGGQHSEQAAYDARRTAYLEASRMSDTPSRS